jgi:anti-anti-sigma factor
VHVIAQVAPASADDATDMVDRCPCARPFTEGYAGCPAYQETTFTPTDTMDRPLGSHLTCRHLTFGRNTTEIGGFYPRCALGGRDSRLRWLAQVRPEGLEAVQALAEEFDAFSLSFRRRLTTAKIRVVSTPGDMAVRGELEALVAEYAAAVRSFLETRADRLDLLGIPRAGLADTIEAQLQNWTRTRDMAYALLDGRGLAALDIPLETLLRPETRSPPDGLPAPGPVERSVVHDDGVLRICRSGAGRFEVAGDIDAATAPALAAVLSSALGAGDDLEVDLGGILFCDLTGVRTLLRFAESLPAGVPLALLGIPSHLLKVMRAAGWEEWTASLLGAPA